MRIREMINEMIVKQILPAGNMGNIQRARGEYAYGNKGVKYQETLSALECTFQAGEMKSNFVTIIIMMVI